MKTNEIGHERTALILYGTETGTAQDLAEELSRLTQRLHFSTQVVGLDDISATELSNYTVTLFVVATTGQGDFPDNSRNFWTSLLRKKLHRGFLDGTRYALAGLGDSSYPKFNWAARKLDKRLQQLGAKPITESCEADEQSDDGTDGVFLEWLQGLRESLLSKFPLPDELEPVPVDRPLPSRWQLVHLPSAGGHEQNGGYRNFPAAVVDHDERPIPKSFAATLEENERLTPQSHWQDVRLLSLSVPERLEYLPGDALALIPKNFSQDVEILISRMNWSDVADRPLAIESTLPVSTRPKDLRPPIRNLDQRHGVTLRLLLTEYLDITAIPRRSFFAAIARYTDDAMHKERLLEFTEAQYLDEYYDYATRPRRSILEILQEFDSVRIPWNEVINILPLLRPRQFSIASGGSMKRTSTGGTRFELLVAIVKYRTVIKKIREGVCTRYLAALPVGSTMKVVLRTEGRFHPRYDSTPTLSHLLIGAGTGIAPLRALIHEKGAANPSSHSSTLIFGARSNAIDFFFADEWERLLAPSELITAFSRDQKEKVYVQNRIRGHADAVAELICNRNATVIVCGSSGAMPKAVREALVDVLTRAGAGAGAEAGARAWSREEADRYLLGMEKGGRYLQETW